MVNRIATMAIAIALASANLSPAFARQHDKETVPVAAMPGHGMAPGMPEHAYPGAGAAFHGNPGVPAAGGYPGGYHAPVENFAQIQQEVGARAQVEANNNAVQAMQFANWEQEREHGRKNWNRITREQQREYDAQMRAAWLAYHQNSWDGPYMWNEYNDPGFLNYLHGNNPSLWGNLRGMIGF